MQLFFGAQEVSRSCYLLILATPTRHSKGAPPCRYTGVARKVPFKLRPKIGKRCPMGTEKVRAPRGNKNRGNRGIQFEKTEQLLPFGKLRVTECDLIFSTHASERTSDNCVLGVELDKITGCLAYLQQ